MLNSELPLTLTHEGELLQHLVDAAGSWLHYQCLCGNDALLYEDSVRHAIGVCLKSIWAGHGTVQRNCSHPAFSGVTDVRTYDLGVVGSDGAFEVAVEIKWIDSDQPSKWLPRILMDIMRLEMTKCRRSYFLLAGEDIHLNRLFERPEFKNMPGRDIVSSEGTAVEGLLPIGVEPFPIPERPQSLRLPIQQSVLLLSQSGQRDVEKQFGIQILRPDEVVVHACPPYKKPLMWMTTMKYNVYGWRVCSVVK